ncbi:MAG: hypothetical protein WD267_10525 [Balneolales bacterium]
MKKLKIGLLSVIAMMVLTCDRDLENELRPIEGTVQVLVAETHMEVGPPMIVVHFETQARHPCSNFEIQNEFSIESGMIISDFEGILEPSLCQGSQGPATSTKFTDLQDGKYLLEINYEENTDLYNITIAVDSIAIIAEEQSFTNNPFEVSWRFPKNSLAYLCGTVNGSQEPCDNFQAILNEMNMEEFTFSDEGYTPYPDSTIGFGYNAPAAFYKYTSDTDFQEASSKLLEYDEDVNARELGVVMFLISWEFNEVSIGTQQ